MFAGFQSGDIDHGSALAGRRINEEEKRMKKFSRFLSLLLTVLLALSVVSANAEAADDALAFAPGTVLRMATGYNSAKTGLFFDADTAGEGITLADGITYHTGDLKPTWVAVQDLLGVVFEDKYQGNSSTNEFKYWKEQLDQVDMISGTAALLSENGEAGSIVNLAEYLDKMPNFKAYLEANPIVYLSITGNVETGAIYFSPYFDGVDDIERMPLMRTDWVEKLLNGEGAFAAEASKALAPAAYEPYMPTEGAVTVDVVNAEGTAVETVTKNYDAAGNIVAKMNAEADLDGVKAVNMLRDYIDAAYDGYYGINRADLFIGQNAAWDADELVALLRCVVANPQTLNGTDSVQGLFSREDNNNQRRVDMFRFAGSLFGVRGLESRQDYLYVGADGQLHDARQEVATYEALERVHAMAEEGLISKAFLDMSEESTATYLENDLGFMHYDYNQTQTVYNKTKLQEGEKYMAVMVPVAHWFDGTSDDGVFMRFTESWRSVKTDGWGISVDGVNGNEDKLILVEGYMDVIALHQAGFTNAISCLGTALTQEQARLISRYADEVVLSYDSDEAGQKATRRAIEIFGGTGIKVRGLRLTGGKDPDEIIKTQGRGKMETIINSALNNTEYALSQIEKKYDPATEDGKVAFLNEAVNVLAVHIPLLKEVDRPLVHAHRTDRQDERNLLARVLRLLDLTGDLVAHLDLELDEVIALHRLEALAPELLGLANVARLVRAALVDLLHVPPARIETLEQGTLHCRCEIHF